MNTKVHSPIKLMAYHKATSQVLKNNHNNPNLIDSTRKKRVKSTKNSQWRKGCTQNVGVFEHGTKGKKYVKDTFFLFLKADANVKSMNLDTEECLTLVYVTYTRSMLRFMLDTSQIEYCDE